jgi:hypothetical protein
VRVGFGCKQALTTELIPDGDGARALCVRQQCGIASSELIVAIDAKAVPCFQTILQQKGEFGDGELESGLVALAGRTLRCHPERARGNHSSAYGNMMK